MKTFVLFIVVVFPILALGQFESEKTITISKNMQDDVYLAAETVTINATVAGDVVAAGGELIVKDTIQQDLIVAAGEILVKGYVKDDIRASGGTITLDNVVGDDVIVFGGEISITEETVIHGNLISFSGTVDLDGEVKGMVKAYGGELNINGKILEGAELYGGEIKVNGEIRGNSIMVAEEIEIGDNAKFYGDVEYWSEDGEVDFGDSLVNAQAIFNEELMKDRNGFSWKVFGIATLGFWIFYVVSAFLVLLLLNWTFKKVFVKSVGRLDNDFWKSFGYGLIYLFGLPLLIAFTFMIIVGIPISLFLLTLYLFSILFGHLVAALMIVHYWANRKNKSWGFWSIVFIALGTAIILRLLTLIPFIGFLISIILLAVTYGVLALTLIQKKKTIKVIEP